MQTIEVPIDGMDCVDCTRHVKSAIAALPGVGSVDVLLAAEKAIVQLDPEKVDLEIIRLAVQQAGYAVASRDDLERISPLTAGFSRRVLTFLGLLFAALLFVVVVGEWLGLFTAITHRLPWPIGLAIVVAGGYPVFRNVLRATLQGKIIAHTLMAVGVLAALVVGEWATAAVVVFFMRVGDYVERFTSERARRAVHDLTTMSPQTARVEKEGDELEVSIEDVRIGDIVVVRPGEKIPVDGDVVSGQATINQATITGEAMPVEAGPGSTVYAATLTSLGGLRIRTRHAGADTTFGRVIKMVEEAEAHRGDLQRAADRFSTFFLPIVAGIAALTFLLRRDPLATAAVLVVACSCSFALATPIAMLASIGASAKRGLLIKGGKHLEALAQADTLLIDKTGTLTLGRPVITDIFPMDDLSTDSLLILAASAERFSEHPLAEAVRIAAYDRGLSLVEPDDFEALPGIGVRTRIDAHDIAVGNHSILPLGSPTPKIDKKGMEGKTFLYVTRDQVLIGVLAAADTLRPEVPKAIQDLMALGITNIELVTGDREHVAAPLARNLGVDYRADLLPEDKIDLVRELQKQGRTVVMVGDGVNDAPALAQADVGIAMGAAGSDVAIEAAHIALMRDDWTLVPKLLRVAKRTMNVVRLNIGFTLVYNLAGLSLAAFGFLPPVMAAAAQSIPDLGILANSSRLLYQR
ncbi:MAG: heavy metal translocating P-type ATPase [Anaerolineales bacterium]|nr:heavy metal translocating P-type ATPase [Anaerolineales bacterium]